MPSSTTPAATHTPDAPTTAAVAHAPDAPTTPTAAIPPTPDSPLTASTRTDPTLRGVPVSPPAAAGSLTPDSPAPGSPAPDFTLSDQHGAEHSLATLTQLTHLPAPPPVPTHPAQQTTHRPHPTLLLLLFYPFAFSRICGGELRELQSVLPEFERHGTTVLAVSCDPMYALRVYAEQEGFTFPLLSDFWPHGAVARTYGVFDETRGCARRGSFLIDQDGIVRWSVVNPISEPRPVADYLSALTHATPH